MNYYTRALQIFAIAIANEKGDKDTAQKMRTETDIKVLQEYITKEKENTSVELFFYGAGRVVEMLTTSASAIGLDITDDLITFENLVFGRETAPSAEEAPVEENAEA